MTPKFASEFRVGAPNFAHKNIGDKHPKFCPLNFRYDPKIGILSQLLRPLVTELPKFSPLFGDLGWTLSHILPLDLTSGPSPRLLNMEVAPGTRGQLYICALIKNRKCGLALNEYEHLIPHFTNCCKCSVNSR